MCVTSYRDHDRTVGEAGVVGTWTVHKDVGVMVNDIRNTLYFHPPTRTGGGGVPLQQPPRGGGGGDSVDASTVQSQQQLKDQSTRNTAPAGHGPAPAEVQIPPLPSSYPDLDELRYAKTPCRMPPGHCCDRRKRRSRVLLYQHYSQRFFNPSPPCSPHLVLSLSRALGFSLFLSLLAVPTNCKNYLTTKGPS
jgi:hypothetical protein